MTRDIDKSKVYAAEHRVFDATLYSENIGMQGVMALAADLFADPWWVANFGRPATVEPTRREANHSYARGSLIRVALGQERACTLAHEAAHVAHRRIGDWDHAAHGAEFRSIYCDLAVVVHGRETADRLRASFVHDGLVVAPSMVDAPPERGPYGLYGLYRLAA